MTRTKKTCIEIFADAVKTDRAHQLLEAGKKLAEGGDSAVYEPCPICSTDCGVFSSGPKRTGKGCTHCDSWRK